MGNSENQGEYRLEDESRNAVAEKIVGMEKTAEQALKLLGEFEAVRQKGIDELLKEREEIDGKLARLGYDGTAARAGTKVQKPCSKCGEMGHEARKHRGEAVQ